MSGQSAHGPWNGARPGRLQQLPSRTRTSTACALITGGAAAWSALQARGKEYSRVPLMQRCGARVMQSCLCMAACIMPVHTLHTAGAESAFVLSRPCRWSVTMLPIQTSAAASRWSCNNCTNCSRTCVARPPAVCAGSPQPQSGSCCLRSSNNPCWVKGNVHVANVGWRAGGLLRCTGPRSAASARPP